MADNPHEPPGREAEPVALRQAAVPGPDRGVSVRNPRAGLMPDLDAVLAAHVAYLRLLRRSDRTIYERQRAVIRLAAWLGRYAESSRPVFIGAPEGLGYQGPSALPGRLLLDATAADLAAWRASL